MFRINSSKADFYVSPDGDDSNPGTEKRPFATLKRAQEAVRKLKKKKKKGAIIVLVREGTYYLKEPLVFGPEDSGTKEQPIIYAAYPGEKPTISGGKKLACDWKPYRDGIMMCELPEVKEGKLSFTQLFVNGKRQVRARYPNYDPSEPGVSGYIYVKAKVSDNLTPDSPDPDEDMTFSGQGPKGVFYDPDTFTKKRWSKPEEAVMHVFQAAYWGNLQYQIKDIDWNHHIIWFGRGGTQMGAKWAHDPCVINHRSRFFIENVFEELDSPGEWYLDRTEGRLYYMPAEGIDLAKAKVEVPLLKQVIEFRGSQDRPVQYITFSGFQITHTASTFFELYEVPSLGDWAIHRGGSVFFEGARNCRVEGCFFDAVGGNAVFINNYNRNIQVVDSLFVETGDSAICLVGSYHLTVGSQKMFPYECVVSNNLIHDCGVFGKQIAGVFISVAKRITVSHNHIYNMPRAGICINDGTWGGHVIEYNKVHDTCRETSDHGPFNAWGRDSYWCLLHSHGQPSKYPSVCHEAGDVFKDAMETVIVRYNYFRENSGWGLDLDDGASNYHIYNNLCVGVSMKLREGAYRLIENNIWVNGANSPCFHVGNVNNHDRYVRNITVMSTTFSKPENDLNFEMGAGYGEVYTLIYPPDKGPWLEEIDYNVFFSDVGQFYARVLTRDGKKKKYTLKEWQDLGFDRHSVFADPMFVDPKNGDYRVKPESPALKLGFKNFDMDRFGLLPDFPKKWLNEQQKNS